MKLLLAGLVVAAVAPSAHAECAIPTWIGTPSGTTIPEHGSLYVFAEDYYGDRTDGSVVFSDGVPHRWEKTRISDDVVRVDYAAGLASSVTADVGWEKMTYAIDPTWKAPTRAPRVVQYWHNKSEWTCSFTDSWMIQVDQPTAAFRVVFTPIDGTSIEYIEPAQPGENGRSVLELGKHNCIGHTKISPEQLATGGALELYAIRFDGSEIAVTGLPSGVPRDDPDGDDGQYKMTPEPEHPPLGRQQGVSPHPAGILRTSEMRTSGGGISDAIGFAPLPPAAPPAAPIVTNAASGQAFLVIAGVGVGLLFVGMMLAGRKRSPVPVQM